MKYILITTTLALLFCCSKEKQTEKKIIKIFEADRCYKQMMINDSLPPKISYLNTPAFREKIKKENLKPFYTADLNHDGVDDYVVNIKQKKEYAGKEIAINVFPLSICNGMGNIAIALSQKTGKYKIFNPYKDMNEETIAAKISPDGKFIHVLRVKYTSSRNVDDKDFYETDVLMIKNNVTTEYIKTPQKHTINEVQIELNGQFFMTLDFKEKKMYLDNTRLNKLNTEKTYFKKMSKEDEEQLLMLLNDMDFTSIDNSENTPVKNVGNYFLNINYDQNQNKEIWNYGKNGGLRTMNFYDQIILYIYQLGWTEYESTND